MESINPVTVMLFIIGLVVIIFVLAGLIIYMKSEVYHERKMLRKFKRQLYKKNRK